MLFRSNVTTVIPIILDPNYTYINLNINILYVPSKLKTTIEAFTTKIKNAVTAFEKKYLNGFDRDFYYSTFSRIIDVVDRAIISNNTSLKLEKKLTPAINIFTFIETTFNNPIKQGTILSTLFSYSGKNGCFIDDSNGTLAIYRYVNGIKTVVNISIPTIFFDSLDDLNNINTITNEKYFSIYANTLTNDVLVNRDNIAIFNNVNVTFTSVN